MTDEQAMLLALAQARLAAEDGEVPVGAVVVQAGRVVGVGRNAPIGSHDPTAHAEIVALRAAAMALGNYRLDGCELFVTLEPCAMCSGAMLHARLARVVYGAADPRTGAAGSVLDLFAQAALNHHTQVVGGVLAEQGGGLLQDFFRQRRGPDPRRLPLREDALRTPEHRFAASEGWRGRTMADLPALQGLALHYVDESPDRGATGPTLLCIHGGHGWSHDYHTLLPAWLQAGCRVLAVDLIGFGRSDKPKKAAVHHVGLHQRILQEFVERLDLRDVVLVLQGTGGLLALALTQNEAWRYRGLVALDAVHASAVVQRADGEGWPEGWTPVVPERVVQQLRVDDGPGDPAPFPDAGHRAGPNALGCMARQAFTAPDWPAAQVPAGEGSSAPALRMLDAFAMGYSRA